MSSGQSDRVPARATGASPWCRSGAGLLSPLPGNDPQGSACWRRGSHAWLKVGWRSRAQNDKAVSRHRRPLRVVRRIPYHRCRTFRSGRTGGILLNPPTSRKIKHEVTLSCSRWQAQSAFSFIFHYQAIIIIYSHKCNCVLPQADQVAGHSDYSKAFTLNSPRTQSFRRWSALIFLGCPARTAGARLSAP